MKQLLELTENFDVSRPVFRLTMDGDRVRITPNVSHPVYRYRPVSDGSVLSDLVVSHYRESFHIREGRFNISKQDIALAAMYDIRSSFTKFLEKNLDMRNPRQSKVYRWFYRNLPRGSEFNDTLVMVYKYIRSFCDNDMVELVKSDASKAHVHNTVALLEAIMEKYDEQASKRRF